MNLLEQLRTIPQFNSLEKAIQENLTINNSVVEHFAPEKDGYYDEKGDDVRQVVYPYSMSDAEVEHEAVDELLEDNTGYFEDVVHEDLRSEVTEFVRVLIKELRK